MIANIQQAAQFINTCMESPPRTAVGLSYPYVRAPNDCVYNLKGIVQFRVRKELWPKRDTQKVALDKLRRVLGEPTSCAESWVNRQASCQIYLWQFAEGRSLSLSWTYGKGTFISLTDANWRTK